MRRFPWLTRKVRSPGEVNVAGRKHKTNPYPFYARLRAEAPAHRVRLPDGEGGALERHCQQERCSHRLTRYRGEAPLSVAVEQPGRYEIHVRHESDEARVRERFVLIASRD